VIVGEKAGQIEAEYGKKEKKAALRSAKGKEKPVIRYVTTYLSVSNAMLRDKGSGS